MTLPKLVRTSGLILPKNHPEYASIERDLRRSILDFNGNSKSFQFYEDLGDSILIPRFYKVSSEIEDKSCDGKDIQIESFVKPWSDRQKKYIDTYLTRMSGVIQAEPASGKTVMTCAAIGKIKKKTIIFAHKEKLIEQWINELVTHTSLEKEDIGILSTNKFEKQLDKPVVMSTPHVMAYAVNHEKKEFLKAVRDAGFGMMVVDECHVGVGPEKFSLASLNINSKRIYGLSATPSRADNNDIIFHHLGELIYFDVGDDERLSPIIHQIHIPFDVYVGKKKNYLMWGGKFQMSRYYQQFVHAEKLNKKVGSWIHDAYDKGRKILVLGNQIKPLLELAKLSDIPKEEVGLFIPGIRDKKKFPKAKTLEITDTLDLDEAFHKKSVVFSTYGAARDGNNRKDLDTLFMYVPTSNVEQAIGRILRKNENKRQPLVIDIVDTQGPTLPDLHDNSRRIGWFIRSSQKRVCDYERLGWKYNIKK